MGGVSIISSTLTSASGTISDPQQSYIISICVNSYINTPIYNSSLYTNDEENGTILINSLNILTYINHYNNISISKTYSLL